MFTSGAGARLAATGLEGGVDGLGVAHGESALAHLGVRKIDRGRHCGEGGGMMFGGA